MSPLTRQRTPASIHSWWSDSNPTGPNINLHAAAKPLMRLMYHWQAVDFITKNYGIPLSRADVEIYASYLGFKYVSSLTKALVLRELYTRAKSENDARTATDSPVLYLVDELLHSADPEVRKGTCKMLGRLARHESTLAAIIAIKPCEQLVPLLRDRDLEVTANALYALSWIASSLDGAQAVSDAHVIDCTAQLLESPNSRVRIFTCRTLGELARHRSILPAVLEIKPCVRMVSLLRDENIEVIESAVYALYIIIASPAGAEAAVNTALLDRLDDLLEFPDPRLRNWTRKIVGDLRASRPCALPARVVVPQTIWANLYQPYSRTLLGDT